MVPIWRCLAVLSCAVIILSGSVCLSGCSSLSADSDADVLKMSGQLECDESKLGVLSPGQVKSIAVNEGDAVKQDQVLLTLDDSSLQRGLHNIDELIAATDKSMKVTQALIKSLHRQMTQRDSTVDFARDSAKPSVRPERKDGTRGSDSSASPSGRLEQSPALKAEDDALESARKAQMDTITKASLAAQAALDQAYRAQVQALDKLAGEENEGQGKGGWPFKSINRARQKAVDEVIKTKREALEQVYKAQCQSLNASRDAQETALEQSIAAQKKALESSALARDEALKQARALIGDEVRSKEQKIEDLSQSMQSNMARLSSALTSQKVSFGQKAKEEALRLQGNEAELRLSVMQAELAKAKAVRGELEEKIRLCTLRSPIDGICSARNVQLAETVAPGQVLLRVLDPRRVYMRAYVAEGDLGRVKIGQAAKIYIDSNSPKPLMAHVVAIDSQASFTPENVHFKDERTRQAFGVKLALDQPDGSGKPGMPADATIEQSEQVAHEAH